MGIVLELTPYEDEKSSPIWEGINIRNIIEHITAIIPEPKFDL